MSGAPDLVEQRQTGQHVLPLPARPVDMGTWGSDRAFLTGQVAAGNFSYPDSHQHAVESERLRKARLHVEKAIKVGV